AGGRIVAFGRHVGVRSKEHQMNQEAQWTVEIVVDAPLKRVWEIAEDLTLIPQYHPEVDKVDLIAGQAKRSLGVKYQCNILDGRRAGSCVEEVVAYEPERMLATRMVSDTWGIDRMLTDFTVVSTVSRRTETSTILKFQGFYEPVGWKYRLLKLYSFGERFGGDRSLS